MTNILKKIQKNKNGFSLIEILVSLLVLSSAIATMFAGFDTSQALDVHAAFETEAAFLAERELELVKSDLLSGRLPIIAAGRPGRFRNKPGWKVATTVAAADEDGAVRIQVSANLGDRLFQLESFVFVAESGAKK